MAKERSVGVTAFAFLAMAFSVVLLLLLLPAFSQLEKLRLRTVLQMISVPCWFILGIGLLNLKPWARTGIIILSFIYIFDTLYPPHPVLRAIVSFHVPSLALIVGELALFESFIFFFAGSTVKKQFRNPLPLKATDIINKQTSGVARNL